MRYYSNTYGSCVTYLSCRGDLKYQIALKRWGPAGSGCFVFHQSIKLQDKSTGTIELSTDVPIFKRCRKLAPRGIAQTVFLFFRATHAELSYLSKQGGDGKGCGEGVGGHKGENFRASRFFHGLERILSVRCER